MYPYDFSHNSVNKYLLNLISVKLKTNLFIYIYELQMNYKIWPKLKHIIFKHKITFSIKLNNSLYVRLVPISYN